MNKEAKVSTILLVLLLLVSLSLTGYIFNLFQKEQQKSVSLQEQLNEVNTKLRLTEKTVEDYKQKIQNLETQLKTSQEKIKSLTEELEREKVSKKELEDIYRRLSEELSQKEKEKEEVQRNYELTKNELDSLEKKLKKLEEEKSNLENKIKSLEDKTSQVNLGTVVVEQQKTQKAAVSSTSAVSKRLEGKVLVVNKEYDFAVVNLGSKDGIKIGDRLSVYQDNNYLGDIEIERVHDAMSAGKFLSPQLKDKIKEQDKVILK
ncbi:MAG: hypothetical protein N2Z79_01735 [Candidatus Omnitrophica bacterium]|nr:hypothetical protein [Candidatus Omnitrophota bacterium]